MSAINPRASGLWASSRMSYISVADSYDDDAGFDVDLEGFEVAEDDGRTPLDRTIDRIGMGEQHLFFRGEESLIDVARIQGATSGRSSVSVDSVSAHFQCVLYMYA